MWLLVHRSLSQHGKVVQTTRADWSHIFERRVIVCGFGLSANQVGVQLSFALREKVQQASQTKITAT